MMRIDERFCGPPGTGNGGYVSGRLAALLRPREGASEATSLDAVQVTLRAPTPLATDLPFTLSDGSAALHTADGRLLAEAACVPTVLPFEPVPVSFEEASEASERFIGFHDHPYPGCFVCGLERAAGLPQGLALHPGALKAQGEKRVVAAPFRPAADLCDQQGLLAPEFVWAALDCPSWFGHAAFQQRPPVILLGRLAVQVLRRTAKTARSSPMHARPGSNSSASRRRCRLLRGALRLLGLRRSLSGTCTSPSHRARSGRL
jgi:hypothetical protein